MTRSTISALFSENDQFMFLVEYQNGRFIYWKEDKETGERQRTSFAEAKLYNRLELYRSHSEALRACTTD